VSHFQGRRARKIIDDFSDTADFPKMISLRLGERMRQLLASLDTQQPSRRRAEGARPGIRL
jgi:hypothetical protein